MTMDRKEYTVTKLAGPKVAGRVAAEGETLRLTEAEARGELLAGAIVEDPRRAGDPFGTTVAADALEPASKPADRAADKPGKVAAGGPPAPLSAG